MSLLPILWALKSAPVADTTEKLILVSQAEHAFSDGCDAFPSKKTLAEIALSDPKTVQRKLRAMERRGLIARGNQLAAAYIDEWFRPTVYDLLIPYSWFPDIEQVNAERKARGKAPLTPQNRPDIALAPDRRVRSDKGKPRPKKKEKPAVPGDSESPGAQGDAEGEGGTDSPGGGDCESRRGGLRDPQPSPVNPPQMTPPAAPSARSAHDARRAPTGSSGRAQGGSAASGKSKSPRRSKADQAAIKAVRDELARQIPDLAAALPAVTPTNIGDGILAALASRTPQARTASQLVQFRALPRWTSHWAELFYAGKLPKQPFGPLEAMVVIDKTAHDRCDERVDVDSGYACPACEMRKTDRAADRKRQSQPAPTPASPVRRFREPGRPRCPGCRLPLATASEPELCLACRGEDVYA